MTTPIRSMRVWVRLDDAGGIESSWHHGYNCPFIEAVAIGRPGNFKDHGFFTACATLVLDPPEPKKRRAKR